MNLEFLETVKFSDYTIPEFSEMVLTLMTQSGIEYVLVDRANYVRDLILNGNIYKKVREADLIEFKIVDPHLSQQDRPWWKGKNWKTTSHMKFR